jgi:cob(I)alamin adenosyltransferase
MTKRKGFIIIYTGNGKGKTTAAIGMLLRFLSHGMRCAVVQFVKRNPDASEKLIRSPLLTWDSCGNGFLRKVKHDYQDLECAKLGWDLACARMADPQLDFLLLDELNILLANGYISEAEVLETFCKKRAELHIVITGRGGSNGINRSCGLGNRDECS